MSETRDQKPRPSETTDGRLPYEPPGIAWREPYEPVAMAVSCAMQQGNPGCNPGPYTA